MAINTNLMLEIICLRVDTSDLVHDIAVCENKEERMNLLKKYEKYDRLTRLLLQAGELDWQEFNWERAHHEGLFCENDYLMFEELRKFK